jgi:hypothetical protein
MKCLILKVTLLLLCSQLSGQKGLSLELNPHFYWLKSYIDEVPSYLLLNPIVQVNYRLGEYVQPYVRGGRAFVSGDSISSATYQEYGIGTRFFFDNIFRFKDKWTVKRIDIFGFLDYSLTDFGLTKLLEPVPVGFGEASILRVGAGITMRFGKRFSIGVDYGYIDRRALNSNDGLLKALRVGYHFNPIEKE